MRNLRLLFPALLTILVLPVSGQLKYGVRGGINSGTVSTSETTFQLPLAESQTVPDEYDIEYKTGSLGFHIGGVGQYFIGNFFVEADILFSHVKNDIQITHKTWNESTSGFGQWESTEYRGIAKFDKMDIPLLLGYRLGPLRILAGPMVTLPVLSKFDGEDLESLRMEQYYKANTFGYQAGLGIELASLNIDVKYEGPLTSFGTGVAVKGNDFEMDQKMSLLILSIAFVLGDY
ncbi:MAG: PorT family protein [Bacteroidales bacterium]|nr:PorT family protein [Bacteroidales bacterium]